MLPMLHATMSISVRTADDLIRWYLRFFNSDMAGTLPIEAETEMPIIVLQILHDAESYQKIQTGLDVLGQL